MSPRITLTTSRISAWSKLSCTPSALRCAPPPDGPLRRVAATAVDLGLQRRFGRLAERCRRAPAAAAGSCAAVAARTTRRPAWARCRSAATARCSREQEHECQQERSATRSQTKNGSLAAARPQSRCGSWSRPRRHLRPILSPSRRSRRTRDPSTLAMTGKQRPGHTKDVGLTANCSVSRIFPLQLQICREAQADIVGGPPAATDRATLAAAARPPRHAHRARSASGIGRRNGSAKCLEPCRHAGRQAVGRGISSMPATSKPCRSSRLRYSLGVGKYHGIERAPSMPRRASAASSATVIAATLPWPPISPTNRPPGRSARADAGDHRVGVGAHPVQGGVGEHGVELAPRTAGRRRP